MAFKVTTDKMLDATVWLARSEGSLPFELWHKIVSFTAEDPMLKDYLLINNLVIHITPGIRKMTPLRLFKKKKLLPRIHSKTFGNRLQDTFIAFDILEGRKTIAEVLALATLPVE